MRTSRGFTLIEVMITVAILSVMTLLSTQAIQQAIKAKVKIQDQIDDVSRMRDALRLIEADLNQAFHYRDLEKEITTLVNKPTSNAGTNAVGMAGTQNSVLQTAPTPLPEAPRVDPVTQFIGNSDSMNFVTMNNARQVRNLRQADFVEVGYSLKNCKSYSGEQSSSQCLWRRSTPWVDDDVTKGGDEVVLLENVSEFKLRYMGLGKEDMVSDWRSDQGGDASTKNNYPAYVEVSLSVDRNTGGKKKHYSMQIVARVHFPNNVDPNATSTGAQTNAPAGGAPATVNGGAGGASGPSSQTPPK